MHIEMLKAKIHQARVTGADIYYEGSIGIDSAILEQAGMYPYEKVLVVDIENGSRLETYIIPAEHGSKEITLNGAAARLVSPGDRIIIMAFCSVEVEEAASWQPRVLLMDQDNRVSEVLEKSG